MTAINALATSPSFGAISFARFDRNSNYHPDDNNPFNNDKVELGGLRNPGKATILGAGSPRDWDIRKGNGVDGAWVNYLGGNLKPFDILIELWDFPIHALQWLEFSIALTKPGSRDNVHALSIYHPSLNAHPINITACVVQNVTAFESDDDGIMSCRITCLPFGAPRPILKQRPVAAIPVAARKEPIAQDAGDLAIQELLATQKALGGNL